MLNTAYGSHVLPLLGIYCATARALRTPNYSEPICPHIYQISSQATTSYPTRASLLFAHDA